MQVRPSKATSDGLSPVLVCVCWKGNRMVKSTGVKVDVSLWDKKKQLVKTKHPNSSVINEKLRSVIGDIERHIDYLDRTRKGNYNVKDCFDFIDESSLDVMDDWGMKVKTLAPFQKRYIENRGLKKNTADEHINARKKFEKFFGTDFRFDLLDDGKLKRFASWLSEQGLTDGSVRSVLSRISAVHNWCVDEGLLDYGGRLRWQYGRDLKQSRRMYCLPKNVVKKMFDWCIDKYGDAGTDYTLKPEPVVFFCAMFTLGGVSPIDFSLLKKENVEAIDIENKKFWKVSFQRRKTGQMAQIILTQDDLKNNLCFGNYLSTCEARNGYIYPVQTGLGDLYLRSDNVFGMLKKKLVKWCEDEGIDIDKKQLTYYVARHSYASIYANQPKASLRGLASIMGRSVVEMEIYIHQLKSNEEMLAASSVIQW